MTTETVRPAGSAALEAHALSKRYRRGTVALEAIDLSIAWGGLTALVGPNGAGKSTLIKAWVGLERPTGGQAAVAGIDPWRDRVGAVSQLGYVPQAPALYRELTVADHISMAASLRRRFDRPYAHARLMELGVPLHARVGNLSGGQQAQVALALALGLRAAVLLLDEPLASLDPLARREFLNVLSRAVQADGLTALLSSHVVADIEQACDRLIVLGTGHKVLDSSLQAAVSEHATSDEGHPTPSGWRPVAVFAGPDQRLLRLLHAPSSRTMPASARAATLEEVVLGYLAAARDRGGTVR
jgi:ABC-2 type transport system ATP-binding protein